MLKVKMLDKEIDCQLDTGAAISILSERQWIDLGKPKLNETDVQPTNFDGTIIKTLQRIIRNIFCCEVKQIIRSNRTKYYQFK